MAEDKIKDKILKCKDCKRTFVFTVNEQKFFGQKGYKDPVRCKVCRRMKKIVKLSLEDGVPVSENVVFEEVCDKCGRKFYTKFKRKEGERIYCDDCWTIIKYGDKQSGEKGQGVDKG